MGGEALPGLPASGSLAPVGGRLCPKCGGPLMLDYPDGDLACLYCGARVYMKQPHVYVRADSGPRWDGRPM